MQHRYSLFCDFDGTISTLDSLVYVFDKYCPGWRDIEHRMETGAVSQRDALKQQSAMIHATIDEMLAYLLAHASLRDGFSAFLQLLKKREIPWIILSGGYATFIHAVLQNAGFDATAFSIESNDISRQHEAWQLVENSNPKLCDICSNCKSWFVEQAKKSGLISIYIGDGKTDMCAAERADIVFATGRLQRHLAEKNISHYPFQTFEDINRKLASII